MISMLSSPLIRIIPIPEALIAVAIAAIVSPVISVLLLSEHYILLKVGKDATHTL